MFDKPLGGTELMYNELMNRVGSKYDHLSIFNYIGQADFNKTTVYWNQLSYDQQGVQWLSNPNDIDMIDHFVFVSHWQAEKYRQIFKIPGYKTHVIKNACLGVSERQAGSRDKVRLCYMSTPWRGLDVLLQAWELIKPKDAELHIFSSCKIYGPDFADSTEQHYQQLYDKCSELPNVVYRGSIPNDQLRKELHTFDILAYPNTFEETSCIAVIEALSTGLRVVTSNIGALPETTEGWARMYPYLMNKNKHAEVFSKILAEEIDLIKTSQLDTVLELQKQTYAPRWSWDQRITEWITFLNSLEEKSNASR